ncbi:hypothetical protein RRG08_024687 [Elysia crispata]|uniref:Phosphodiesterase n=1 Tax=Elysia crispata TaxID=231223 RepID=A0AAE1CWN7_9GAST|nr:hypothetical protein RRG08_024687 [Elysia crispata]
MTSKEENGDTYNDAAFEWTFAELNVAMKKILEEDTSHIQVKQNLYKPIGFYQLSVPKTSSQASEDSNQYNSDSKVDKSNIVDFPPEQIYKLKQGITRWDFDLFATSRLTDGHAMQAVAYEIVSRHLLLNEMKINEYQFMRFIIQVERHYRRNPYHNASHAADVLQSAYCIIFRTGFMDFMTPLELFTILVTAAVHDIEHTGTNNNFHKNAGSEMAKLYMVSILENHHVRVGLRMVQEYELLKNLSRNDFAEFKFMLVSMILSTDMSNHFLLLTNMRLIIGTTVKKPNDRLRIQRIMMLVLHAADISNSAKNWDQHKVWITLLCEEFFRQGDKEKELQLPISPSCDRNVANIATLQIGFMQTFTKETFDVMDKLLEKTIIQYGRQYIPFNPWQDCMTENLYKWSGRKFAFLSCRYQRRIDVIKCVEIVVGCSSLQKARTRMKRPVMWSYLLTETSPAKSISKLLTLSVLALSPNDFLEDCKTSDAAMYLDSSSTIGGAVVLLLFLYVAKRAFISAERYASIPKVTPRLPIFGNAHILDLSRCHMVLAEWAERFGPVYRIKIFMDEILVLNSYESIQDALVKQDAAFAGRPPMYRTSKSDRDRHSIVWQTYTPKLRFLRREITQSFKIYGGGRESLEHICAPELEQMLERIRVEAKAGSSFDPVDIIYDAVCNVILRLTLDSAFEHNNEVFQLIKSMNHMFNDTFGTGSGQKADSVPFLCELGLTNFSKRLDYVLKMRDRFWDQQLKALRKQGSKEGVIPRLLKLISTDHGKKYVITEQTAKEVFTNLLLAGTDTTTTALTCLLLVFLHYPEVQEKMRSEQCHKSAKQYLTTSEKCHMPYTQAVLIELLRFISHVPLAVPHYTTCDTSVLDIPVPKNMTIYVNLWAAHHDSKHWPDPWTFDPDRFLDKEGNLLPPCHPIRRRVIAFGAGRRVCLGEALAKHRLFLFASTLVKHFRFVPSEEDVSAKQLPPVDPRTYEMGLVLHPRRFKLKAETV